MHCHSGFAYVWGRVSIKQIIFKGTVVFMLGKRSGVAEQKTSISAAEAADSKCYVGQDTETASDLKLGHTVLQPGIHWCTSQPPSGSDTLGLCFGLGVRIPHPIPASVQGKDRVLPWTQEVKSDSRLP